jgi:hypothetical protein
VIYLWCISLHSVSYRVERTRALHTPWIPQVFAHVKFYANLLHNSSMRQLMLRHFSAFSVGHLQGAFFCTCNLCFSTCNLCFKLTCQKFHIWLKLLLWRLNITIRKISIVVKIQCQVICLCNCCVQIYTFQSFFKWRSSGMMYTVSCFHSVNEYAYSYRIHNSRKLPDDDQQSRPKHVGAYINQQKCWATILCRIVAHVI